MTEKLHGATNCQASEQPKKPYTAPQLTRFGTVTELTKAPPADFLVSQTF